MGWPGFLSTSEMKTLSDHNTFRLQPKPLYICPGVNDLHDFADGWYGLQRSPEGLLFRSTSAHARLKITGFSGLASVSLLISARPEHTGFPIQGVVTCGEDSSFAFQLTTNHWTLREGNLTLQPNSIIDLHITTPWSPDKIYHNGDARQLGIMVSAVRISSTSP